MDIKLEYDDVRRVEDLLRGFLLLEVDGQEYKIIVDERPFKCRVFEEGEEIHPSGISLDIEPDNVKIRLKEV